MCSNESPPPRKEPLAVGLDTRNPMAGFLPSLEHYRYIYHYAMAERFRLAQQLHPQQHPGVPHPSGGSPTGPLAITTGFPAPLPLYPAAGYPGRLALSMALLHPHHPRIPEEPKPQHSYIGLIGMAILSSPEKKLVLSDIYQHILDHYSYFRNRGPGWRNSIRHNLSLNDCFVKSGRSANGKGHYWAIHPANIEDFRRGDFRRRKAQQKVRRHMGLAVDDEPDSPSPPPLPASPPPPPPSLPLPLPLPPPPPPSSSMPTIGSPVASQGISAWMPPHHRRFHARSLQTSQPARKRQFDVASLLAPDDHIDALHHPTKLRRFSCSEDENDPREPEAIVADEDDHGGEEDVDVDGVVESSVPPPPSSPSSSPVSKASPTDRCWTSPSLHQTPTSTPFAAIHLHNHLHVRNYYAPTTTNPGSGSSV